MASAGNAFDRGEGDWFWMQADLTRSYGKLTGFWLNYRNEFKYSVGGATIEPRIPLFRGAVALLPSFTLAGWSSDSLAATFGVVGLTAEAYRQFGKVTIRLTGDVHSAGNNGYSSGRYVTLGADAYRTIGRTSFGAGTTYGRNPVEYDAGFVVWASRSVSQSLQLDVQLVRPLADAVFGSPGTFGVTLSGSWRMLHKRYRTPAQPAVIGRPTRSGRSVRFEVRLPKARRVALSGSFTEWAPVAMRKNGDLWTVEVPVKAGTHQYGFLVDDEDWYLPPGIKGVDDGFGRKNATLVVPAK